MWTEVLHRWFHTLPCVALHTNLCDSCGLLGLNEVASWPWVLGMPGIPERSVVYTSGSGIRLRDVLDVKAE
jgi:hypothetical protein